MKLTNFGRFNRMLRLEHEETLYDAAQMLGCSSAHLSSVEHGKRSIPKDWEEKIVEHYRLSKEQREQLHDAIALSANAIELDLSGATAAQKQAALRFQRSFPQLDDKKAKAIMDLLDRKEDER